jgi:hypothetical protein
VFLLPPATALQCTLASENGASAPAHLYMRPTRGKLSHTDTYLSLGILLTFYP